MCHKKKKKEKKKGKKKSGKGKRKVRWRGRLQETRWGVFLVVYCFFFFFFFNIVSRKRFPAAQKGQQRKAFPKNNQPGLRGRSSVGTVRFDGSASPEGTATASLCLPFNGSASIRSRTDYSSLFPPQSFSFSVH